MIEVSGKTVGLALESLVEKFPPLRKQLYTEEGNLRSFLNVYVNEEDIRYLQKGETIVAPGDTISIVPSIAGGRRESLEVELCQTLANIEL